MKRPLGLSALDRCRFDVNGYVVIDGVLDGRRLSKLRTAVEERVKTRPGPTLEQQRFGGDSGLLGLDQEFRKLLDHPVVIGILGDLIGPYVRLDSQLRDHDGSGD